MQHLRSASWHGHLERGLQLLIELCDLVTTIPALAQIPAVRGLAEPCCSAHCCAFQGLCCTFLKGLQHATPRRSLQEARFQQSVMELAVLVLLSTAGPDCADCLEAAGAGRRMQARAACPAGLAPRSTYPLHADISALSVTSGHTPGFCAMEVHQCATEAVGHGGLPRWAGRCWCGSRAH